MQKPGPARLLIAASLILVLGVIWVGFLSQKHSTLYVSDVFILMRPFTNSLLKSDFERHLKQAFPKISEIHFQESSMIRHVANGKAVTNSEVVIQIVATGVDADDAIRNANEIAPQFCNEVARLFTNSAIRALNHAVGASNNRRQDWQSRLGLKARKAFEPTAISGTVNFVNADVLLSPIAEWEQHYLAGLQCPPALIHRKNHADQFLSASLLSNTQTNIVAAAKARLGALARTKSNIDSLREDSFSADSGAYLVRVTYCQNDNSKGRRLRSMHSEYFTTNGIGQIVRIDHLVIPADTTNDVHQMIIRTLRLK